MLISPSANAEPPVARAFWVTPPAAAGFRMVERPPGSEAARSLSSVAVIGRPGLPSGLRVTLRPVPQVALRLLPDGADGAAAAGAAPGTGGAALGVGAGSIGDGGARRAPVQGGTISAVFGQAGPRWSSGHHTGLDFAAPVGTPVRAAAAGRVVSAGWSGPYGRLVTIRHADGSTTAYAHLAAMDVAPGTTVAAGQRVGSIGMSGNTSGPHLHFEVRPGGGGFMDPALWLAR